MSRDIVTAFGNRMFTKMVNILFGGDFTDVLVGFRALLVDIIPSAIDEKTQPVLEFQMPIHCLKLGLKVTQILGDEPKRTDGTRKMHPLYNGSCLLYTVLRELFARR